MAPGHTSVAGTVVGTLAGLGVFAAIVYFSIVLPHWRRKRREKKARKNVDPEQGEEVGNQELTGIDPNAAHKEPGDTQSTSRAKDADQADDRHRNVAELETRNSSARRAENRSVPGATGANGHARGYGVDSDAPRDGTAELESASRRPKELSINTRHAVAHESNDTPATSPQTQEGMAFSAPQSEPDSAATTPPPRSVPDSSAMTDVEYEGYLRELQGRHDQIQTRKETLLQLQKMQEEEDRIRDEMAALQNMRGRQEVTV